MKHPHIKNIIFDFGGVIIDIDYNKCISAFQQLGAKDFDKIFSQAQQMHLFDELDKGTINPEFFIQEIKKFLPQNINEQQIIDAWNTILIGIPKHRIELLESVCKNYRIFLMSNTNIIHYTVYTKELQEKYGYLRLDDLFEKAYFSFKIHLRKPDKQFFKLILEENNLNPSETLFIDDSPQNLPPAEELGINTFLLDSNSDITTLFENGLLKNYVF